MTYLERNRRILAEIKEKLRLKRGHTIDETNIRFTSLGHYASDIVGNEVYVGLKELSLGDFGVRIRALRELAFIQEISERFPGLLPELPVFYGILADDKGTRLGIIMEDYSRGGSQSVTELTAEPDALSRLSPIELQGFFGYEISDFEIARTAYLVNGRRRLGDFHGMIRWLPRAELEKRFPLHDWFRAVDDYAVQIDYPIA